MIMMTNVTITMTTINDDDDYDDGSDYDVDDDEDGMAMMMMSANMMTTPTVAIGSWWMLGMGGENISFTHTVSLDEHATTGFMSDICVFTVISTQNWQKMEKTRITLCSWKLV